MSTPNPSYSLALRLRLPNQPGQLAQVLAALAAAGGNIGQITLLQHDRAISTREIIVAAATEALADALIGAVQGLPNVELLEARDRTFALHQGGKLAVQSRVTLRGADDLAMAYTPGVGRISQAIARDPSKVFELTCKGNMVAVVSDGSAVLGLGNLGPAAALPVMEGKAVLFKEFAGIDAFPICLATQDTEEIIRTVQYLAPVFGGINLEDIAAPRCFEIERRLRETLDIPVFHDDQHG
ncbi:MAG TPA: NAD-dependent malic enzyme, partial [Cyanobacteria bacterium UBA8156]|nr:NAD-dependent malic enzyme [Cyanobacteria bacterium UBA8156]